MTPLFGLKIYGPCTLETLAGHLDRLDLVRLDLELWCLESHDLAYPSAGPPTTWDLTPLGRRKFKRDIERAKDEARLCQGVETC